MKTKIPDANPNPTTIGLNNCFFGEEVGFSLLGEQESSSLTTGSSKIRHAFILLLYYASKCDRDRTA